MQDHAMPFPRGRTYGDNGVLTMTATLGQDHEGRVYEVPDSKHNTGQKVKLRVVRNVTGGDITVAWDGCEFATTPLGFGRKIAAFGAALSGQGVVAKPMDDVYGIGTTIPENDLFYVVESGPCYCRTEGVVVNLPVGTAVAYDAAGRVNGARAAAGQYVFGTTDRNCVVLNEPVVIHVNEGLDNEGA